MNSDFLKKLNLPPSELNKILKKLNAESVKTGKTLKVDDIFTFFALKSAVDLEIYKSDPSSSVLLSFAPTYDDFLMDEDDEVFEVIGYDFLHYHVLINLQTLDLCIQTDFKVSRKPNLALADLNKKIMADFPELNIASTFDLAHFASTFDKPSLKNSLEIEIQNRIPEMCRFEMADEQFYVVLSSENKIKCGLKKTVQESILSFQFLLRFFIDTGSRIDLTDPCWRFHFVFAENCIVGFLSSYQFNLNAVSFKTRISQLLILGPFQGRHLGSKLVHQVYEEGLSNSSCKQITVEDPNDSFTNMQLREWLRRLEQDAVFNGFLAELDFQLVGQILDKCRVRIAQQLKTNRLNSELVLDVFLLRISRVQKFESEFHKYLTRKINQKFEKEANERNRKMKRKFLSFEGKVVSLAKIQKIYQEIQDEEAEGTVGLVVENRVEYLDKSLRFFS